MIRLEARLVHKVWRNDPVADYFTLTYKGAILYAGTNNGLAERDERGPLEGARLACEALILAHFPGEDTQVHRVEDDTDIRAIRAATREGDAVSLPATAGYCGIYADTRTA